jgi:uracil-DNA glycosylase
LARKLSPETEEAVRARIAYFRDLGVFDFYRRGKPAGDLPDIVDSVAETVTNPGERSSAADSPETPPMSKAPLLPIVEEPKKKIAAQDKAAALAGIRSDIGPCTRCELAKGRHTIVFGDGDPNARLMFVGEGPGADEDAQGLPFVGRAGQLLNNMIAAMGLRRDQVYIANIVKCRPPQNRVPEPVEAHTCVPFLYRQIDVIGPEVIVALGSTAATYLLGAKSPLSALRGRIHQLRGAKLIVTYHPAFLLRDPRQKKEAWADLQIAMAELGLAKSAKDV